MQWTVIRASWFAQNFDEGAFYESVLRGEVALPAGDVLEPFLDVDDIADIAVAALTDDRHHGQVYEVTGPRLMTFAEMAEVFSRTLGRHIQHIPITFEDFHANVAVSGGDFVAEVFTQIARETLDGRNAHTADGVERALGRKPRDFAEFAQTAMAANAWPKAV